MEGAPSMGDLLMDSYLQVFLWASSNLGDGLHPSPAKALTPEDLQLRVHEADPSIASREEARFRRPGVARGENPSRRKRASAEESAPTINAVGVWVAK